jgi:hypothetical protein
MHERSGAHGLFQERGEALARQFAGSAPGVVRDYRVHMWQWMHAMPFAAQLVL